MPFSFQRVIGVICVLSRDLNTATEKTLEQLAPPLPVKLLLASREELCVRGVTVSRGRGSLPLGGEHSSLLTLESFLGDFAAS